MLQGTKKVQSAGLRARAEKLAWQLEAFALAPSNVRLRLWRSAAPRVLCSSIPKAGTNLVLRALCLHPLLYRRLQRTVDDSNLPNDAAFERLMQRVGKGQIVSSHLRYSTDRQAALIRHDVRHVFVIRDPRDILVSYVHYARSERKHYLHDVFAAQKDFHAALQTLIVGLPDRGLQPINERLDASAGWLRPPNHVVRFEDLVGARGGGSEDVQLGTLQGLFDFLGLEADEKVTRRIAGFLFSSQTRTFRSGVAGEWRAHFDDDLRALFDRVAGRQLVEYGYERARS